MQLKPQTSYYIILLSVTKELVKQLLCSFWQRPGLFSKEEYVPVIILQSDVSDKVPIQCPARIQSKSVALRSFDNIAKPHS